MLFSLRLRSASALLLLGGCRPFELTWISDRDPDDCLMRGRRLRGLGGTLCDVWVGAALPALRARVGGVPWGIHSSERSSSHGCVVSAIVASRAGGWSQGVVAGGEAVVDAKTRWRNCYECAHGMLGGVGYLNGGRCSEQRVAKVAEEPIVSSINIQGSVWAMIGPGPWAPRLGPRAALPHHIIATPDGCPGQPTTARRRQVAPSRLDGLEARNVKPCFCCMLHTFCAPDSLHRMH
jgi:hypothetical protein